MKKNYFQQIKVEPKTDIFMRLDFQEIKTLRKAITLFKTSSALLDYAENIESCEIIENQIDLCFK